MNFLQQCAFDSFDTGKILNVERLQTFAIITLCCKNWRRFAILQFNLDRTKRIIVRTLFIIQVFNLDLNFVCHLQQISWLWPLKVNRIEFVTVAVCSAHCLDRSFKSCKLFIGWKHLWLMWLNLQLFLKLFNFDQEVLLFSLRLELLIRSRFLLVKQLRLSLLKLVRCLFHHF